MNNQQVLERPATISNFMYDHLAKVDPLDLMVILRELVVDQEERLRFGFEPWKIPLEWVALAQWIGFELDDECRIIDGPKQPGVV